MARSRRKFLQSAAGGAAALAASTQLVPAQPQQGEPAPRVTAPSAAAREAESGAVRSVEVLTADRPGGDFMVDVIKSLGFEYVTANPGSSFRGLHESLINYGGNKAPEFITCCHEESAVAMGHGYAKIEGKPLLTLLHATVGTMHGSMAIYNAYADRAPVYLMPANSLDATTRRPGVEWEHSVQDGAALVRDFIKWDDQPTSLQHWGESAVRAYKIAMTPPMGPVLVVVDSDLQEESMGSEKFRVPKLARATPPQGDSGAVAQAARWLVDADNPVIVVDRAARTPAGVQLLVDLAMALQAPVIDQGGRMNFPSRHPLNLTDNRGLVANADVILGLELTDFWGTVNNFRDQVHRTSQKTTKPTAKLVSITAGDLFLRSNYQDFQRYTEVDLAIAADTEATLPALIEAVKKLTTADRKRFFEDRGKKLAQTSQDARERARNDAAFGWDSSPISTARLSAEVWAQIKKDDWSLVSEVGFASRWPLRLWDFTKHSQYIGGSGAAGVGYGAPASAGAALANRKYGRLSVAIQNDGDLMYAPGVLWTQAHHRIPLLSVMHNNRGYHQEVMHIQRMSNRHQRGVDQADVGTRLINPNIDFAGLAKSLGVYAEGPIADPKDLGPALARAAAVVRKGEPALVDVVTQPR